MIQFTANLGETKTFTIPLRWGNRAFVPGGNYGLVFTVKSDPLTQLDAARLFQKSGPGANLGIEVTGSTATVEMLRSDTYRVGATAFAANPGLYYWDIRATHLSTGASRIVASGTLDLNRDVTRLSTPSGPIYSTEEPVFRGPTGLTGPAGPSGPTYTAGTGIQITGSVISATGGGTATVVSSLTPPSNTSVIWFDPSDCTLSVYNGFYWVTDGTIYNIPDGDTPDNAITFNGDILTFNGDTLTFAA